MGQPTFTPEQRVAAFWSKVDRRGPEECWPWKAARHPAGYGTFWNGARLVKAHRHAWTLLVGPIAEGLCALHRCDNPPCCNPAHMFLGTDADNQRDARAKGRAVDPPPTPRGESQHLARLTEADVREIRRLFQRGHREFGSRGLARRFGVDRGTITAVIKGLTWKHVA